MVPAPLTRKAVARTSSCLFGRRSACCGIHTIAVPVGNATLGRVLDGMGRPIDGLGPMEGCKTVPVQIPLRCGNPFSSRLSPIVHSSDPTLRLRETGIKGIDLLFPLFAGEDNFLVGPKGSGKTRLALELRPQLEAVLMSARTLWLEMDACPDLRKELVDSVLSRFGPSKANTFVLAQDEQERQWAPWTALALAKHWMEETPWNYVCLILDDLDMASLSSFYHWRGALSSPGTVTTLQTTIHQDMLPKSQHGGSKIVLSESRASQGIFPALDFAASQPSVHFEDVVGSQHYEIAIEVMGLLTKYHDPNCDQPTNEEDPWRHRANLLSSFLTQPLWHGERFRGTRFVPVGDTIQGCREILQGKHDRVVDPKDLAGMGSMEEPARPIS